MAKGGCVYIMTNRPRGVLYIGVAADIGARVFQHRSGNGSKFARKYNLTRLVHIEVFESITDAITREKRLKEWKREWKVELIEAAIRNGATFSRRSTADRCFGEGGFGTVGVLPLHEVPAFAGMTA